MQVFDVMSGRPLSREVRCSTPLYVDGMMAVFGGGRCVDLLAEARRQRRWVYQSR